MSSKEKYEKIIKIYKHSIIKHPKGFHTHHIYPKSIWPDAKDEPDNLVKLPPIVHWYAHKLLNEAFIELGMNEYANKLIGCCDGIAQFINKGKARTEQIDFNKEQEIVEFLDKKLDLAIEMHDSFIQKREEIIDEWISAVFVCIMGKAKDAFSVKVKKENELYMSDYKPMSLKEAEALAKSLCVPVTRYISDKFAEKYGISNIPSIRDKFDMFNDAQNLITYKMTKNMREPLAFDITDLVVDEFRYKSAMPDIFDIDIGVNLDTL